jgi:hypothetical protein
MPGNDAAEEVEAGAAVHLRFIIGQHYRGGHPGTYLPPGPTDKVTEPAAWQGSWLSGVESDFKSIVSGVTGGTYSSISTLKHKAVSWYEGHILNTNPSVWAPKNVPMYRGTPALYDVTNVIGTPTIAAQRRRRKATGA